MTGIPDWVLSALFSVAATALFCIFYFWGFYLGNHPDRAMLAMREHKHLDEKRLRNAAALFEAMDHAFQYPNGFEKCDVSEDGKHMTALYEDGKANCYYCGVVAQKIG